jgi:hypothetical protein
MDRAEVERMLRDVGDETVTVQSELVALQGRLDALMKTNDALRLLLETSPARKDANADISITDPAPAPNGTAVQAGQQASEAPVGGQAAKAILQGDQTKFWTVREAWEEQRKRGWNMTMDAMRIALIRLNERDNRVERVEKPTLAYRWKSEAA